MSSNQNFSPPQGEVEGVEGGDDVAIRVTNLSKSYQIYDRPQDRLKQSIYPYLQGLIGRPRKSYYREFWAMRDVSFEVREGETVGIIGRNGSGKSTLLQMICGTLNPTSGSIETRGRVAALLELGSGFNPEFTGRENAYMNGAVLGLSKDEMEARYADIAAFSDIGDFINQPVKTYSSGMVVRLAFAVAINVDPKVLVIDEALSVGDELFQRKCFSRIEAIKNSGGTILFVSHSGAAVVELCDRAVLLDSGELLASGAPKFIVGKYQKLLYAPVDKRDGVREEIKNPASFGQAEGDRLAAPGSISTQVRTVVREEADELFDPNLKPHSTITYESCGAVIERPQILNKEGEPVNCLKRGRTYLYTYTVRFERSATSVRFGMLIKSISGLELGGAETASTNSEYFSYVPAGARLRVEFRFRAALNPGSYFLNAGVLGNNGIEDTYLHRLLDVCMFRVLPDSRSYATAIVDFDCVPDVSVLS